MRPFFLIVILYLNTISCFANEIWVDAINGNDNYDGLTAATALRTLQVAATLATPGTTVRIQPGIYREYLRPANSGTAQAPIIYRSEQGVGSVIIRGSESATTLVWTPLTENSIGLPVGVNPGNIIWTDLSAWNLAQAPRFVMQLDATGQLLARLPPAREPDWPVPTEWKYHEFWWSADGGFEVAACDPLTDKSPWQCDQASRSLTQLTDFHDDNTPVGVEPGNLTTLGNLIGATLVVMDTSQGHLNYRRTITNHEVDLGRITITPEAPYYTLSNPGLGWGSKYYVENHPALLDQPGEYWFDTATNRLYLWPLSPELQPYLEISRRDTGWDLTNLSYLILDGLTLEFFNDKAIRIQNGEGQSCYHNKLSNLRIYYANHGLFAEQTPLSTAPTTSVINGLVIENSQIGYLDSRALNLSIPWSNDNDNALFTYAPIVNTLIKNNGFHHIGFRPQYHKGIGILFDFADHLRFENNHVHHVAHHGVVFSRSIIQSDKTFNFAPHEIKTGDILFSNNLIEHTCQNADDCGAVTFQGNPPQGHVFRNVLVTGNTFRHSYGWSSVTEQRKRWDGYFGFGLYLINASGIHAYRNLAYNNGWAGIFLLQNWRDGQVILSNNLLANAKIGLNIWNAKEIETHGSVGMQLVNNIIINNEYHAVNMSVDPSDSQLILDHNLYYANGWGPGANAGPMKVSGKSYILFEDVQSQTGWEINGINDDPKLFSYDYRAQRQRGDNSVLDFELKRGSAAIEKGTATLPLSLQTLLTQFEILDLPQQGTTWDIGAFEYVENHQPAPSQGSVTAAIIQPFPDTLTQFTSFITTGFVTNSLDQRGNQLILASTDRAKMVTEMNIDPADIGQLAQLGMVIAYTPFGTDQPLYFMRQDTQWVPWNEDLSTLGPAQIDANLPLQFELYSPIELSVYEGDFHNLPGHFTLYVGYLLLADRRIVFNGHQPIRWTIQ